MNIPVESVGDEFPAAHSAAASVDGLGRRRTGYGAPLDRVPAAVLADLLDSKITTNAATLEYGVVITPDGTAVAEVKTKESRASLRQTRR